MTLTPAQQKALDWLPSDGSWRESMAYMHGPLADLYGHLDKLVQRQPGWKFWSYRLTTKGIAYKAGREG